jgi:hypothetical protein
VFDINAFLQVFCRLKRGVRENALINAGTLTLQTFCFIDVPEVCHVSARFSAFSSRLLCVFNLIGKQTYNLHEKTTRSESVNTYKQARGLGHCNVSSLASRLPIVCHAYISSLLNKFR